MEANANTVCLLYHHEVLLYLTVIGDLLSEVVFECGKP